MPQEVSRVSPVEAHLRYWLRCVSNHISHEFELDIQQFGVTVAEWVLLREIYEKPAFASPLARKLGTTAATITRLADRLESKELLCRRTHRMDRRARLLTLTDHGECMVPELAELADRIDARFFGGLDVATRDTLERVLKWIAYRHRLRFVPMA